MKVSKLDQLGLHLQKFGASLKMVTDQVASIAQQIVYIGAAMSVLRRRGLITDEEISREIELQKAAQRLSDDSNPGGGS